MPIFRANGQLHYFAHVPKAGGTAVEALLADRFGTLAFLDDAWRGRRPDQRWSRSSPQHILAADFARMFPPDWIASSFAVVRHPLTRFVSAYHHAFAGKRVPPHMTIELFARRVFTTLEAGGFTHDNHFRKQAEFVPDTAAVFKLEDGLEQICDWIDQTFDLSDGTTPTVRLKHGSYGRADIKDRTAGPVSDEIRSLIAKNYKEDFDRFDYDPEADIDIAVDGPGHVSLSERVRGLGNAAYHAANLAFLQTAARRHAFARRVNAQE